MLWASVNVSESHNASTIDKLGASTNVSEINKCSIDELGTGATGELLCYC